MSTRIRSIDVARGAVMVLMAIDHVRAYAGVPAGGPTAGVFFTRWVTHFCAPAFIFLAGTSAFLQGRSLDKGALSRRLLLRGLWIVLLELTIVRIAWGFNLHFERYLLAGVLWVIGWCMVAMALLVRLPVAGVGAFGVALIAAHNLTAFAPSAMQRLLEGPWSGLWRLLYFGGRVGENLFVLYSFVPWIGVMAAGYAFGTVMIRGPGGPAPRLPSPSGFGFDRALFLLLRGFCNLYGDRPWSATDGSMPGWLAFLNTTKYPASLLFLLMTLGPVIALLPALENAARAGYSNGSRCSDASPFGYYLLHIPLIHLLAMSVSVVGTPRGHVVALRGPSAAARPAASRLPVESGALLHGDRARGAHPLLPVPRARGSQGPPTRLVAVVSVAARSGLRAGDLGQRGRQSAVTEILRISPGLVFTNTSMGEQQVGQSSK